MMKSVPLRLASLLLVITYSLIKRIKHWPQLTLGLTLIGEHYLNDVLSRAPIICLPLYFYGIMWTLMYNFVYPYWDKRDDAVIGLKSMTLWLSETSSSSSVASMLWGWRHWVWWEWTVSRALPTMLPAIRWTLLAL